MIDILAIAVELNNGHRRDALINLSELLAVSVDTVRRWANQSLPIPRNQVAHIRALHTNHRMKTALTQVRQALELWHG